MITYKKLPYASERFDFYYLFLIFFCLLYRGIYIQYADIDWADIIAFHDLLLYAFIILRILDIFIFILIIFIYF